MGLEPVQAIKEGIYCLCFSAWALLVAERMNRARGMLLLRGWTAASRSGRCRNATTATAAPLGRAADATALGPDRVLPAPDYRTWLPDGAVKLRIQVRILQPEPEEMEGKG